MSLLNVRLTPVDQRIRSPVSQAQRTPANKSTTTTQTIAISHGTASSTPRSYIEPTIAAKPPCTASLFLSIVHLLSIRHTILLGKFALFILLLAFPIVVLGNIHFLPTFRVVGCHTQCVHNIATLAHLFKCLVFFCYKLHILFSFCQ